MNKWVKVNRTDLIIQYVELKDITEYERFEHKLVKKSSKSDTQYLDMFATYDSETSNITIDDKSYTWVYQWAIYIDKQCIAGRKISEFIDFLNHLINVYALNSKRLLVIYVHNLSFDATFFIDILNSISEVKCLWLDSHKLLTLKWKGIEFRCSYKLSNMSLDKYCQFARANINKLVGAIDYNITRFSDSHLSDIEWEYQINDVMSLHNAIENEMKKECDNVATIPLTSTGYIRRLCRHATRNKSYRNYFLKSRLDCETYKMCKREASGGLTHGNRFYSGKTLISNVTKKGMKIYHYDLKSDYPARQQLEYFPCDFKLYYKWNANRVSYMKLEKLIEISNKYCTLSLLHIKDLKLKHDVTCPFLSSNKILNKGYVLQTDKGYYGTDNGKVINAIGIISIVVTELDLKWLLSQYTYSDIQIDTVYISNRCNFPNEIQNVVNDLFTDKETLEKDSYFYAKQKNRLNGVFGMTFTNPIRDSIEFDFKENKFIKEYVINNDTLITEKLNKFYNSRNNFMPYQLGCYTTSHARNVLLELIANVVGYENFIYCDTDSIFFFGNDEIIEHINKYNEQIILANKERGLGVINRKGNISYYGTFEDENDNINKFRFLHAKCYAFENDKGLFTTIAGVRKSESIDNVTITNSDELGSIDNLEEGFTFVKCGGTRVEYVYMDFCERNFSGHIQECGSGAIIRKVTKTLSQLETYSVLDIEE